MDLMIGYKQIAGVHKIWDYDLQLSSDLSMVL